MEYKLGDPQFSDVHFVLQDGGIIHAHKAVLESQVEEFRSIILQNMREHGISIIKVTMTRETITSMLSFIYTSVLNFEIKYAAELMHYSERFKLVELRKKVAEQLAHVVTMDNISDLFLSADQYQVSGLKKACLQIIQSNFSSISKTEAFFRLCQNERLFLEVSQAIDSQKTLIEPAITPIDTSPSSNFSTIFPCPRSMSQQFQIGKRYNLFGIYGTVRYFGKTKFDNGKNYWLGIETDLPVGTHDGSIESTRYFNCKNNHGLFVGFSFV